MIRKLRRKFILTNMLLVSLVLAVVFALQVGSGYQRARGQTMEALRFTMSWGRDGEPARYTIPAIPTATLEPAKRPRERPENTPPHAEQVRVLPMVPAFLTISDGDGQLLTLNQGSTVDITEETAQSLVTQAMATGETEGSLSGQGLRFLREERGGQLYISFATTDWEIESLLSLLRTALLVGVVALGGFFLISLLLSGLALKPVAEAWEQQRRFVADASHELKTPLTVILTNTGILLSHQGDTIEQQQKWVEYIRDEAQRMRGLVEDLLFLAKSDAGKERTPDLVPADLSELTWSALLPFEPVAFEQGVSLESDIAENLSISGRGEQLRRLVAILLDNAVKYAGEGGRVTVALSPAEKGGACLTVTNTGPAIPAGHLPHLFERFYRSDNSRARTSGGYGLGLSIAKSIVDGHRGSISVSSSETEGTTFTVKLPG